MTRKKIISLLLSFIFIFSMVSLSVYANSYNVTSTTENVTLKGASVATNGQDYEFMLECAEDYELSTVFSEISASMPQNRNNREGTGTSTTFLTTTTDDTAFPEIRMVEDTDSPMKDVLKYKRVITDSINGNSPTTYKNQNITSLYSSKPSTISFGFWLKESDIESVFGDKTMQFWPIYQGGPSLIVDLPLASLMANVGVSQKITPTGTSPSKLFTNYDVSTVCTARDNGWAHFVCNMENLTYNQNFSPTSTIYFYLTLNNITSSLRENRKIEMSNFTYLINDKIESGYIVYPTTQDATSFKSAVKKTQKGFAIDKAAVKGNISITANAQYVERINEYNVSFDGTYVNISGDSKAYSNADYTFTLAAEENTELYETYAKIHKNLTVSRNYGEGIVTSPTFLPTTTDDGPQPGITFAEDNDSPMKDVLPYKRVITDSINLGSTTTYKNLNVTKIYADKPSTISFGFWLKESDIQTVFGDKPLDFWPLYRGSSSTTFKVSLPLKSLMANVGKSQAITPTVSNINKVFTNYSVNTVCTARDNGWAHFVCNMENLTYNETFTADTVLFYLYLANISTVLRQNNKIEMSNFTFLTNDKIQNGYIVYPTSASESGYKLAVKTTEEGTYIIPKENIKGNITITSKAMIIPEEGYEPKMKLRVSGNEFYVRTHFDENNDLLQKFRGLTKQDTDYNDPIDFGNSGLVPKTSDSMSTISTLLSTGGDEATPFKYNASYIGANHGQSNAILATATNHGKTYADIGSLWKDARGDKWNLLKIVDSNTLMFLSENMSTDINKYTFKNTLSGTLTYVECAKNTGNITIESIQAYQQLYSSTNKIRKDIYAIINGKRYKAADGVTTGCDYVEIIEKYQIKNPATIGKALRDARPEGGYTEPQNLAIGSPIVDFNMTYRITPDGTVLSIFDHEILENINFLFYGGIQYVGKRDAFGGGIYRYIPKLKKFTHAGLTLDFTETVNMTTLTYPSGFSYEMSRNTWEGEIAPDRQVDYFKDASSNIKVSFAGGFLPLLDGEIQKRSNNINSAGFVYQTKKTYPYFVDSKAYSKTGTKNQRIQGIAYKKYNSDANGDISYYTIPYGKDTYIYVDCHEIAKREFDLSYLIKDGVKISEIEKSQNVTYSQKDGKLTVEMESGTYGYLALCVTSAVAEPQDIIIDNDTLTAKISNNTHEEQNVQVVVATYNEGRLKDVKTDNITLADYQTYKYSIKTTNPSDKVKVFLWEDITSASPISEALEK